MGHSYHTEIIKADTAAKAFHEMMKITEGVEPSWNPVHNRMRPTALLTTPNKALRDMDEENLSTEIIPVCSDDDVITDVVQLKFSLNAEQYQAFKEFNDSDHSGYRMAPKQLTFLKDTFGIDLPGKHAGRQQDATRAFMGAENWKFTSSVKSHSPEGSVVKKFYTVKSDRIPGRDVRLSNIIHDSQADAAKEAREWVKAHPEFIDGRVAVHSTNVRSEGSNDLVVVERVMSKAVATIPVTLERMKPNARQAAWAVGVDYHY